jgi:hypothetical protein
MAYVKRCGTCAALLAAGLVALGTVVRAQDELGGAKTLYVNASYEEALSVLDKQAAAAGTTGAKASEVQHYRALCFIALGRAGEADQAIALSVSADPFTVPDTSELAPRVASVFTAARARLIPEVARAALAEGRQLMQKGDAAGANRRFEAVTRLLSEPGLAERADLSDLALAATAFAELTKAQMAAAAAAAAPAPQPAAPAEASAPVAASGAQPPPAPRPGSGVTTLKPPAAAAANMPAIIPPGTPGLVPAIPVSQVVPPWQPGSGVIGQLGFTGAVKVTIDATGKVIAATMSPSVYPPYDRLILTAARDWVYRPATLEGQPVASERLVEIVLRPRTGQ